MPQTITVRVQATVTCALSDLVTVNIAGLTDNQVFLKNNGPGVVWFSFDSTVPASVAGVQCFGIKSGETFTRNHVYRGNVFTAMADTASTILCISSNVLP